MSSFNHSVIPSVPGACRVDPELTMYERSQTAVGTAPLAVMLISIPRLYAAGLTRLLADLGRPVDINTATVSTPVPQSTSHTHQTGHNTIHNTDRTNPRIVQSANAHADLILIDLDSIGSDNAANLRSFIIQRSSTPSLLLASRQTLSLGQRAIAWGARGVVPNNINAQIFLKATRAVLNGQIFNPMADLNLVTAQSTAEDADIEKLRISAQSLTPRQLEVLSRLAQGQPNKSIARELSVSENTIKAHLKSVFRILGAKNRTEAVSQAARLRLVLT